MKSFGKKSTFTFLENRSLQSSLKLVRCSFFFSLSLLSPSFLSSRLSCFFKFFFNFLFRFYFNFILYAITFGYLTPHHTNLASMVCYWCYVTFLRRSWNEVTIGCCSCLPHLHSSRHTLRRSPCIVINVNCMVILASSSFKHFFFEMFNYGKISSVYLIV